MFHSVCTLIYSLHQTLEFSQLKENPQWLSSLHEYTLSKITDDFLISERSGVYYLIGAWESMIKNQCMYRLKDEFTSQISIASQVVINKYLEVLTRNVTLETLKNKVVIEELIERIPILSILDYSTTMLLIQN